MKGLKAHYGPITAISGILDCRHWRRRWFLYFRWLLNYYFLLLLFDLWDESLGFVNQRLFFVLALVLLLLLLVLILVDLFRVGSSFIIGRLSLLESGRLRLEGGLLGG